jgi:hypothetical protein
MPQKFGNDLPHFGGLIPVRLAPIMDLSGIKSYEELAEYLRGVVNFSGDVGSYDFAGVVNLLGALLDNIASHALDADIEEIAHGFTSEQVSTLKRIVSQL